MDDFSDGLGVGFGIDAGQSFTTLTQLETAMDSAEAKIVQNAERIERATTGMFNLGGATATIRTFGGDVTRAEQQAARSLANVEKAGESLSRQLDRQAASFGKTREEIRAAKVETAALAAEQQGLTELATRLRAQEQALFEAEFAAARKSRAEAEAAAEEKERAAAAAAAAAEAEAAAVRKAADAYRMFEAVARQKSAAYRQQLADEAAAARSSQDQAAAAERLRASIDPAYAAQQRFNSEMEQARRLVSAGAISLDEYVAKLRLERAALTESGQAARGHGNAMAAMVPQVQDALTQASMGANMFSVLAIQGGQAASQMVYMEGAAGKFASFMMSGWGLALQAGLFVLGALTEGLFKGGDASDDMSARQSALASQLDQTTGKIKEQVTWLSILSNSREAEGKLQKGATAYRTAQGQLVQGGRTAGIRFLPDQEPVDTVSANGRAFINQQLGRYNGGYNGGLSAEQVVKNLNAAAAKDPSMRDAVKQIEGYAFAVDKASANNRTLQVQLARTAVAMGTATAEQRRLVAASTDTATGDKSIIDARAKLAGATTTAGKAQAAYALQLAVADQQYEKSKKTEADQQRLLQARTKAEREYSTAQEANSAARRAASAASRDARKEQTLADQLAREAAALEAQISNLNALADAYRLSGGAALIAEARVKGESKAIKERGDIEAEVARQVRLAIAQRVSQAEQGTASIRAQAAAQDQANAKVAAGLVPAERAEELIKNQIADLPLLAAIEAAQQQGLAAEAERATKALSDQRAERERLAAGERTRQFQASQAAGNDRIAELEEELRLIDATDAARTRALATLRATQEASRLNPEDRAAYIAQQVKIADLQQSLNDKQRAYNDGLTFAAEQWDLIARNVENAGRGMAEAFGDAGRAIGDIAATYANYRAQEARAEAERKAAIRAATTDEERRRANARYSLQTTTAQVGAYGDMASAAKGFFDEGSRGYAALAAAEKTFRAIEFALSVRAMAQDAAETATSIANSVARTAKHGVEAVVKAISTLPFPLNIAAGAATAAAVASLGVSIANSFGGSGRNTLEQPNTGTGRVFGNRTAQSDSIKNAIDALKQVDTLTNTYAREMSASLKSIDSQIGGFTKVLVRAGDINASAGVNEGFKTDTTGKLLSSVVDPTGLFSKIPVIGGIFSGIKSLIGSLFGSTTTVIGSGLYGNAQSLGSILSGGFDASYYSDIEKKKRFLGITTGKSYSTQYSAADPALENQFTLILRSFNDAVAAAAGPLGESTQAIQQRLNGFVISIGKIDLKGLTGEQIQEKLSAIFGAAADGMANAAFPGLQQFQKVGEGAFETLVRVASTVEQVTASLDLLGNATKGMGVASKLGLADQFDSLSAMNDAVSTYFQAYYTQEEQTAAKTAQMAKAFGSLGFVMPQTLDAFRHLVEAQDLTTAAGQATYATLLKLAPAFADLQQSMQGAKSAADILSERQDLERQLLEVQGKTDEIRKLDLAKLDASNRALQLQIWAIQDAQSAAQAADELRKAWTSVGDSIMDEVKRIRGLSTNGGATSFAMLMGRFNTATQAARSGDQDAAKSLPQLSQALLSAAAEAATSRQELARVRAETAASLEATYGAINRLGTNAAAASDAALLAASGTAQATAAGSNDNGSAAELRDALAEVKEELRQLRSDNNAGNAAIAANTGRAAKVLDNVTSQSGGDAIATVEAA